MAVKDRSGREGKKRPVEGKKKDKPEVVIPPEVLKRYRRHASASNAQLKVIPNKKAKGFVERQSAVYDEALKRLALSEVLLTETPGVIETENPGEKVADLEQQDILGGLDLGTRAKAFEFDLPFGPFSLDVTRNGRYLLTGGRQGALSIVDLQAMDVKLEINVQQTVRDVKFLMDETMIAAAQKKYVHIYDHDGIEIHCLRNHEVPNKLEYLPYHFLLASVGEWGKLQWQDISTGQVVANYATKKGPCNVMCQNPSNAVIHLGHSRGTVSLWTPNSGKPCVEFLAHKGALTSIAVFKSNYLATAGYDGLVRIWDNRVYRELRTLRTYEKFPTTMDGSQSGMLAIGMGSRFQTWKDLWLTTTSVPDVADGNQQKPMENKYVCVNYHKREVSAVKFRPFEDFCLIGTSGGIASAVVPGSCLPNIDTRSANPYETKRGRRERQVHELLDKIPPSMITLDTSKLGGLDEAPQLILAAEDASRKEELSGKPKKEKKAARGRSSVAAIQRKKQLAFAKYMREKARDRLIAKQMEKHDLVNSEKHSSSEVQGDVDAV